jgi:hypothetical protein
MFRTLDFIALAWAAAVNDNSVGSDHDTVTCGPQRTAEDADLRSKTPGASRSKHDPLGPSAMAPTLGLGPIARFR